MLSLFFFKIMLFLYGQNWSNMLVIYHVGPCAFIDYTWKKGVL